MKRRDFFKKFIPENGPEEKTLPDQDSTLDKASTWGVEKIIEAGLLGSALELAINNIDGQLITLDIEPKKKIDPNSEQYSNFDRAIESFLPSINDCSSTLRVLSEKFRDFYHKSKTVWYTVPVCSGAGKERECHNEPRSRTEWYWDEPDQLINTGLDHNKIDELLGLATQLRDQILAVRQGISELPATWDGVGTYDIEPKNFRTSFKEYLRGGFFMGFAALAGIYEEIITTLKDKGYLGEGESLRNLARRDVKRRSILKIGVAYYTRKYVQSGRLSQTTQNADIEQRVRSKIDSTVDVRKSGQEKSFQDIFQTSVLNLEKRLHDAVTLLEQSIAVPTNYEDANDLHPFLENTYNNLKKLHSELVSNTRLTSNGGHELPEKLVELLENTATHRAVMAEVNNENGAVRAGFFVEILKFAFATFGLSLGAETLVALSHSLSFHINTETR